MRRIFTITLALVLVLSCSLGVSAADVPGQYDVVDLLPCTAYTGNVADAAAPIVTGSRTLYSLGWDTTFSGDLLAVVLTFSAPAQPTSVVCNGVTGTLLSSGTYYQYRFTMSRSVDSLSFAFNYSTATSRRISVLSCSGMVAGQVALTSLDEISFRPEGRDWVTYGVRSLPYEYWNSYTIPGGNNLSAPYHSEQMRVFYNVTVKAADYFTAVYYVPCLATEVSGERQPWASEPIFWLCDGSTRLYALETINYQLSMDSYFTMRVGDHLAQNYPYRVIATCDLSGYDLSRVSDPRIEMDYSLYGIYYSGDTTNYFSFGSYFLHAVFGVHVDYSQLSAFSQFISRLFSTMSAELDVRFSNLTRSLDDFASRMDADFNSLWQNVRGEFVTLTTNLTQMFDTLGTRLEQVINPQKPDDTASSQEKVDSQVDSINQFEQQQFSEIQNGTSQLQTDISNGVNSFVPALAFIGRYTSAIGIGIQDYIVVFMMPIYLGIFFFVCNRVAGATHISSWRKRGD